MQDTDELLMPLKVEEYTDDAGMEMRRVYFTNTEKPDLIVSKYCWFKKEEN